MTELEFCHTLFCSLVLWLCLVTLLGKHLRREGAGRQSIVECIYPLLTYLLEVPPFPLHWDVVAIGHSSQDGKVRWDGKYKGLSSVWNVVIAQESWVLVSDGTLPWAPCYVATGKIKCSSTNTWGATIQGSKSAGKWEVIREWWGTIGSHPSGLSFQRDMAQMLSSRLAVILSLHRDEMRSATHSGSLVFFVQMDSLSWTPGCVIWFTGPHWDSYVWSLRSGTSPESCSSWQRFFLVWGIEETKRLSILVSFLLLWENTPARATCGGKGFISDHSSRLLSITVEEVTAARTWDNDSHHVYSQEMRTVNACVFVFRLLPQLLYSPDPPLGESFHPQWVDLLTPVKVVKIIPPRHTYLGPISLVVISSSQHSS